MNYRLIMFFLVALEWVLAIIFIRGILTGVGTNFSLGTIIGAEFIIIGLFLVCYIRAFIRPRLIAEDREEGLLW